MMKRYKFAIVIITVLAGIITNNAFSQIDLNEDSQEKIFFDAVCFRSDTGKAGRVDVFILLPYNSLKFMKNESVFVSSYEIRIKITDSTGRKAAEKNFTRRINTDSYSKTLGSNGEFDYSQSIFNLSPGKYTVIGEIKDNLSNRVFSLSRSITVIDFSAYPFSASGLMLVSAIEEKEKGFVITPHISDNVGDLTEGFFTFFETYNAGANKSADFIYLLFTPDGREVFRSDKTTKDISGTKMQQYLRIKLPNTFSSGKYILRVLALKPGSPSNFTESDYLAVTERSIRIEFSVMGRVFQDIATAIEQLRYVAEPDDVKLIESGKSNDEKRTRLDDFWKKLDPSPNTERNEAFEQYYTRIDIANKKFRTYSLGWRSDMGMVFIIYGYPDNVERSQTTDGRIYEKWTYQSNRQFIFIDNSGFGDFRLYSPMSVTDKYQYNR
jgi:GWxTD domain-containing protein